MSFIIDIKQLKNLTIEEIKEYLPLLELFEAAMTYTPLWDISNGKTLCEKCHKKKRHKGWKKEKKIN